MSKFRVRECHVLRGVAFQVQDERGVCAAEFTSWGGATRDDAERCAETLNARQPKPRYYAFGHVVYDRERPPSGSPDVWFINFYTPEGEKQAADFAAKLNAEEQK